MKDRSNSEIISAGVLGFGLSALLLSAGGFAFAVFRAGWESVFYLDQGGAPVIAFALFLFVGLPALLIGLPTMACLAAVGARSPWFALVGIAGAALIGTFMEYSRRGVPDLQSGMMLALYTALACAITIALLHRQTRKA
jgi:hypothetical protein